VTVQVIRVDGLKELRRDLRAADRKVDRKLATKLKRAAEIVAADARDRVPTGPGAGGHAADSIKAGVSGPKAFVKGGGDAVPYYGWLDFGTRSPNTGQPRSVGPWAGTGKGPAEGRFVYPAIEANSEEVTNQVRKAVDEALNEVNL
jgi:HK97 gp10 family phage protein